VREKTEVRKKMRQKKEIEMRERGEMRGFMEDVCIVMYDSDDDIDHSYDKQNYTW
jgi:hypothetical protein